MTRSGRIFVAIAFVMSLCVFSVSDSIGGWRRQCRYQIGCSPCLNTSAVQAAHTTSALSSNPQTPEIQEDAVVATPQNPPTLDNKPAPRPLPEGVTAVTPEQLVNKIPSFSCYDDNFEPEPGKRVWIRANDHQFFERHPIGKETAYDVLGRATVEQFEETIVVRVESNDTTAPVAESKESCNFIADKTLEIRRIYFDHPDFNSGNRVYLGEMKSVE